jgi:ATP-dependent Clp protease ATP-binding subunit ClpC
VSTLPLVREVLLALPFAGLGGVACDLAAQSFGVSQTGALFIAGVFLVAFAAGEALLDAASRRWVPCTSRWIAPSVKSSGPPDRVEIPDTAVCAYREAGKLFEDNRFSKAIDLYTRAIKLAESAGAVYPSAYFNRALCHAIDNRHKEATADADVVERLEPGARDSAYIHAIIAEGENNIDLAEAWYEQALSRDPDYKVARDRLDALRLRRADRRRDPTDTGRPEPSTPVWMDEGQDRRTARAQKTLRLDEWSEDLIKEAAQGSFLPLVGRKSQIESILVALGRSDTPNSVLLGPAGVGKTAIIEELARRIAVGEVPEHLRKVRLLKLNLSRLLSKSKYVGNTEKAVAALVEEATSSDIVLFIDELHTLVGAGSTGRNESRDVGQMLKSELGRGELRIIGADTDEEFRRFIEPDAALAQRFVRVRVPELSPEETRIVLETRARAHGLCLPEEVGQFLVEAATSLLPGRALPRGAVQLLDTLVAGTAHEGNIGLPEAQRVVAEATGLPADPEASVGKLFSQLASLGVLGSADAETLVDVLGVRLLGLSPRLRGPCAVVAVVGKAADRAGALAEVLGRCLYGSGEAQVLVDLTGAGEDPSALVGVPTGRVGSEARVAVHDLLARPGSVVRIRGAEGGGWQTQALLAAALREGVLTDSAGVRIGLSASVVVIEAREARLNCPIGVNDLRGKATPIKSLANTLGAGLASQIDLVVDKVPETDGICTDAVGRALARVSLRVKSRYGKTLEYSKAAVTVLAAKCEGAPEQAAAVIETSLGSSLRRLALDPYSDRGVVKVTEGAITFELPAQRAERQPHIV